MIEEVIIVGNCKENEWRRKNLMACKNLVEDKDFYIVSFTQVTSTKGGTNTVKIVYKLVK